MAEVELSLVDPDDPEGLHASTDQLMRELSQANLDALRRKPSNNLPPPGTRGVDAETIGTLVAIVSSPAVIQGVVDVTKSWITRRARGSIRVKIDGDEIELTPSPTEQRELLKAFIERHSK